MAKIVTVLTIASLTLGLVAMVSSAYSARLADARAQQQHEDAERRERQRDREHIRQLETFITQEFPKYTWAIDWDQKWTRSDVRC